MALATNKTLISAGLAGALTSVFAGFVDQFLPGGKAQSLFAVIAGMAAAIVTFEAMAWFVVLRLRRMQRTLERVLPIFERLQSDLDAAVGRQVQLMKDRSASKTSIKSIEADIDRLSQSVVRVMLALTRRNTEIIKELAN